MPLIVGDGGQQMGVGHRDLHRLSDKGGNVFELRDQPQGGSIEDGIANRIAILLGTGDAGGSRPP
jgi:hypothetical protein